MDVETSIQSVIELITYRRMAHEPIDDALARFEILKTCAEQMGDFGMGIGGLAWMLLQQLH
eukprot:16451891-Heterocapsa_arctica.AAC.1